MRKIFQSVVVVLLFTSQFVFGSEESKVGLYLSFEQRLGLTYALLAKDKGNTAKHEIFERAVAYFKAVDSLPIEIVKVNNFEEFLQDFRGEWPGTQSVALDVQLIEEAGPRPLRQYRAVSPRIQKKIDDYIQWQSSQITGGIQAEKSFGEGVLLKLNQKLGETKKSSDALKVIEKWAFGELEFLLDKKMGELDRVGEKMAESGFAAQQDPKIRIFMQTLFTEYFSHLGSSSKKLIVSSYLGEDLNMTDIKKFEIMVQNSGPQLQKLLQVVARQANLSSEMLEVFRGLESSVRPVPWVQVEQLLKSENENYTFTYFEKKPLGVGTMAQVHRAKIEVDGVRKDVVVRFIKPGIAARVEEDHQILTKVAQILDNSPAFKQSGAPLLGPIVKDLTATVSAELNQEDTIKRQNYAKTRYEKNVDLITAQYKNLLQFHVPTLFAGSKKKSKFMVQELVIGKKLDKEALFYADLVPHLKRAIVEATAKLWAEEVMFGEGFYHSDLHQGNFLVLLTEPKVVVNILDYGMGGVISPDLQRQSMVLGAGIDLNDAELIGRSFWKIARVSISQITEKEFKSRVRHRVQAIHDGFENKVTLEEWTTWAIEQGIQLPYEFISLNRGVVIVNKLLEDAGSKKTIASILKDYARSHPITIYKILVTEEHVPVKDIIKLGWGEMKKLLSASETLFGGIRCEIIFQ